MPILVFIGHHSNTQWSGESCSLSSFTQGHHWHLHALTERLHLQHWEHGDADGHGCRKGKVPINSKPVVRLHWKHLSYLFSVNGRNYFQMAKDNSILDNKVNLYPVNKYSQKLNETSFIYEEWFLFCYNISPKIFDYYVYLTHTIHNWNIINIF